MSAPSPGQPRQRIEPALRELRERRGWSLQELANRSGISRSHLSRLEQGRSVPSFRTLHRLAETFGVDLTYFTGYDRVSAQLEAELAEMLERLEIPSVTWNEFRGLSIEARGALVDALRRLTADPPRTPRERQLETHILERGVAASIDEIRAAIAEFGDTAMGFARSLTQIEEQLGERMVLANRLAALAVDPSLDYAAIFRVALGADPPEPMLLRWWSQTIHSGIRASLQTHDSRTVYPRQTIESYVLTNHWGPMLTLDPPTVRRHIEATMHVLREHPRYKVGLVEEPHPISVHIKDDRDVLVTALADTAEPTPSKERRISLRFSRPDIVAQFRAYFEDIWERIPPERKDTRAIIAWLEELLRRRGD